MRSVAPKRRGALCALAYRLNPDVERILAISRVLEGLQPEIKTVLLGNRVRDLNKIQSEAYRQVEEIRGVADAKAAEIYARACNQSPEAMAFYEFTRTIQAYKTIIVKHTTLVLSTDSELFKYLKEMPPGGKDDLTKC